MIKQLAFKQDVREVSDEAGAVELSKQLAWKP